MKGALVPVQTYAVLPDRVDTCVPARKSICGRAREEIRRVGSRGVRADRRVAGGADHGWGGQPKLKGSLVDLYV